MTGSEKEPVYLVTGSLGCIGAWTLRHLVVTGARVVSFDLSDNRRRLDLLLSREEQERVTFVQGEITDFDKVLATVRGQGVNRIIHLAALQIPFCKADPVAGAHVNVVGTVNIFEAARQTGLTHLSYASSIAVYGAEDAGEGGGSEPDTLYGVYKRANEGTARVYWHDHALSSIGLRPYTVYGVGRDQGLTSEPTKAMLAAAAGEPYQVGFGGRMQFHFASDVARQFIAAAATPVDGAPVFNLGTSPVAVSEVVEIIRRLRPGSEISHVEEPLPFPEGFDAGDLKRYLPSPRETPLEDGVRETIEHFEALLANGKIDA
ncbi:MAG: NAD-dependent epimerase/dehydratase [Trueperaceae bacterium]